jgi:hypothetical protein
MATEFVSLAINIGVQPHDIYLILATTVLFIHFINQGQFGTLSKIWTTLLANSFRLGVITQIHREEWYHG